MDTIRQMYEIHILDQSKQPALLVLLAFLVTFITVRILVHRIRTGRSRFGNLTRGDLHIHHLVWGILLILVTGFITIATMPENGYALAALAIAFGAGAALTLDEFALWLHLEDVYWEQEGRQSIDAVVITASVISLFVIGRQFLTSLMQAWIDLDRHLAPDWLLDLLAPADPNLTFAMYAAFAVMTAAGLWLVFDRTGWPGWLALLPVVNLYVLVRIAGKPGWWALLAFIPLIGAVAYLLVMIAVAGRFQRGRTFGLALAVLPSPLLLYLGSSRGVSSTPRDSSSR